MRGQQSDVAKLGATTDLLYACPCLSQVVLFKNCQYEGVELQLTRPLSGRDFEQLGTFFDQVVHFFKVG